MTYTRAEAKENLKPVYPAYNPMFTTQCRDCGKTKHSNDLMADLGACLEYVCSKCCFVYYKFDPRDAQIARDSLELKVYGKLNFISK